MFLLKLLSLYCCQWPNCPSSCCLGKLGQLW